MPDGIAWRLDSVEYPAADERALQAMLLHPGSSLLARPGRRPGPGLEATIGGTPEAVIIAAGGGVIDDTDLGTYVFVIPTPVTIELPARPATGNSRIDYVLARMLDEGDRPGDTLREPDVYLLSGSEGASPTAPTIPAGHLRLARLDVPAVGSIAVSGAAQRTTSAGGILTVADTTERDAISPVYDGLMVYREDADLFEGRVNGAWEPIGQDTGWVTLTKDPTLTSGTLKYRVKNGHVTVYVDGAASIATGTSEQLTGAAIPAAYRPSAQVRGHGYFGGYPGTLTVGIDGHFAALHNSGATRASVSGAVTYPVE